jgi:hypothetical protein
MASTYSTNLAIELIGTGDQAGAWGNTTNTNLGTLIEQAISGYVTQAVATGTDTTITIPNGATGVARNMFIELTGTGGTNTNLIVPSNKKLYFVYNNASGAVTVKVSGQTGISVAAGEKQILVSNGTDIVKATSYVTSGGSISFDSLSVTTITATSGTITNLNSTSANITTLTGTTFGTTATTQLRGASAQITTLTGTSANITTINGTSANITTVTGTTGGFSSANITTLNTTSGTVTTLGSTSANITTLTGTSATITNILDGVGNVRNIPRSGTAKTSVYTLAITDIGEYIELGTSGGIDVPNGVFATGNAVSVFNNTTGNTTISLTITTAYIAGTDSDKASVSLATRGVATILFISNSVCVLTGNVS